MRHPKQCRYFSWYGRCKFFPCSFLHVDKESKKVKELEARLDMKDDDVKEMKKTADDFKLKIGELETKLSMLENQLTRRMVKMESGMARPCLALFYVFNN